MGRRASFVTAVCLFVSSAAIAACSSSDRAAPDVTSKTAPSDGLTPVALSHVPVCPSIRHAGGARCHSHVLVDASGKPFATSTPTGYAPKDIQSAYEIPSPASGGAAPVVGIVDAYDDPNAESDLAAYRSYFGLPPCTTANGCFRKVNQSGTAGSYPAQDSQSEWPVETALDLDAVSAACPSCKIVLVEANSDDLADLGSSVNTAVRLGAAAVSNSYGGSEDSTNAQSSVSYYDHPGVLVTASAGDTGYGAEFPATSQYVLAVGGTSLAKAPSARGWSESTWFTQAGEATGSGCSAYTPKPSWQKDTSCAHKTVNDVSAVADPYTGIAVYNTAFGAGGWTVIGGTSLASPLVAAIFAVTGRAGAGPSFPYANTSAFWDVTSGSDGSCGGTYLCTAGPGYDAPTGVGTPNATRMMGGGGGGGPPDAGTDGGGGGGTADGGSMPPDAGSGGSSAPPSVTLVSPADGATLIGNAPISLEAGVTSSVGLASVVLEWMQPSGTVAVDCASPPSGTTCTHTAAGDYTWSFTPGTGARSWYVVATDTAGASTTSATSTLTLAGAGSSAPTLQILEPAAGSAYAPGGTVPVVVSATGPAGVSQAWLTWSGPAGSTQLQLSYLGGSEWGLYVPFSSSAASGPRTLTVTAYDPSNVAGSAVTTIYVQ
jgi:hypothetical protein